MKVPIRRPDFKKRYATPAAYARAVRDFRSARAAPAVNGAPSRAVVASDAGALARGSLPRGFSMRSLGNQALESAGARIVSEHEGAIGALLLTVPKHDDERGNVVEPRLARHFRHVLAALHRGVKYIIVAAPNQKKSVDKWLAQTGVSSDRVTFVESPRFYFTIWAQDAYVAMRDRNDAVVLCEGVSFQRGEDSTIADDIAAQSDITAMQSYLFFQGGNILGGSNLTLIGIDYLWRNSTRFGIDTIADAVARFERLLGTPVLGLGGTRSATFELLEEGVLSGEGFQPIFHIDMYVTPTGVKGKSGKPIVFLGRPGKAKEVTGHYSNVRRFDNRTCDRFFDETEEQLTDRFEVKTLPLWITSGNLNDPELEKKFYNLTWNNALVEHTSTVRRVLLPSYSEDAKQFGVDRQVRRDLEQAAAAEWKAIGYDVTFMDGLEDLAYGDGSVHCMTKTLRRVD
jgi:hypothetical protein